jgi:4-amino-4-deoxy-L-arabinose transferase-like glycosyltransferase
MQLAPRPGVIECTSPYVSASGLMITAMSVVKRTRVTTGEASVLDNERTAGYWVVLIGIPALLALLFALYVPATAPMPVYLQDAQQYVSSGHIVDTTYPLEFAWLTGLSLKAIGPHGPQVLQTALYLLIVLSVWALTRTCGTGPRYALIAALAAALYPQLPVSVTKVWDVELSVLLMVLLMLCTVCLMRDGPRPALILAAGIGLGISFAQRPNMLLLSPLPVYFCLASSDPWRRKVLAVVCGGAVCILVLAGINTLAHGSFFLPQNGAYNLVQGHNEYSIQVMLRDMTCEPTVALIMKADGMDTTKLDEADPKLQHYFRQRAFAYMRSHPLEEAKITTIKLWTMFRPNTRSHREIGLLKALIVCMSLILPAWLILLLRRRAQTGLDTLDRTFIAALALYVLPFLLTSSDPRYQIPIEICLLSHIAYMVDSRPIRVRRDVPREQRQIAT